MLGEVESATVSQQVDHMLQTSDNYLAETLGRMAAVAAGKPASNEGGHGRRAPAARGPGHSHGGMTVADVSGLALGNQVSARQFSEVVRAITSGLMPGCGPRWRGFPVAGLTGTLGDRYIDESRPRAPGWSALKPEP